MVRAVGYNKVAEYEDFADPELAEIMRDVFRHEIRNFTPEFPQGAEYRKYWEIAMSVRALRHFGALREDARILGVGAGTEATLFYLTEHVGQVIATDLYLNPGAWGNYAPGFMLVEPEKVAPYDFDRNRLIVQHMDGRLLRYADNSFDGIFSSGSIEHFGNMDFIANSAYEMGRVLKPGGVLTLSTEFRISGPPGGDGWDWLRLFSPEALQRYIVEASGLELVDPIDVTLSQRTLESQRDFVEFANDMLANVAQQGAYPRVGEVVWSHYPHLVLYYEGYLFCSVHITLRKSENYPATPNEWARPGTATRLAVEALNKEIATVRKDSTPADTQSLTVAPPEAVTHVSVDRVGVPPINEQAQAAVNTRIQSFTEVLLGLQSRMVDRLPKPLGFPYRTAKRVRSLGLMLDAQARVYPAIAEYLNDIDRRLTSTDQQLADVLTAIGQHLGGVDQQFAAQRTQLAAQEARAAALTEQLQEASTGQVRLESALSNNVRSQGQLSGQLRQLSEQRAAQQEAIDALGSRLEELTRQQEATNQRLEKQVRINTSYARLFNRRLQIGQSITETDQETTALTSDELVALIKQLESAHRPLAEASSVDLSIQDGQEEQTLVVGTDYFGDRLSSKPETYRLPNDVWYHIDFTSAWNREILLENAAGKLVPGGHFVLITDSTNTPMPPAARLQPVRDEALSLPNGRQVRVYIWQRPDGSASAG